MANKFFQSVLYQMSVVLGKKIGMMDEAGFIFSYPDDRFITANVEEIMHLTAHADEAIVFKGYTFLNVMQGITQDFVVFVEGEDEGARRDAEMVAVSLSSMKQFHNERYDKAILIKNIILDNVLPSDVLVRAKELHLPYETPRVIMLIRNSDGTATDHALTEIIQSIFPDNAKDFVFNIDERNTILAKEVRTDVSEAELNKIAVTILDTVSAEAYVPLLIGIGSVANNVKELAKSYKDARVSLEVGKVFDTERTIINYESLGIGRLIYQLPTTLCELFLSEIFKKESIDILDNETIFTIQKFFENDLNVSETSRQLYVHRNTLVYRLDKVQKLTGLDLRKFEHAIVFKIAMMVKKYLVSSPVKI